MTSSLIQKAVITMSNYLNQIESDLYKLNSITDVNGEVVEMVAELKEKYEKSEAFDAIVEKYVGIMKGVRSRKFKVTSDVTLLGLEAEKVIKKYESGEYDAKK